MFDGIDEISEYAKSKNVIIAIETEGSLRKKKHLLMQRPEEYIEFKLRYKPEDIGINLNIGHLNLAAKAFKFDKSKFVDSIEDYILAMELSHNDGREDQHLPLRSPAWYWELIHDSRFARAHKILEFRNTPIKDVMGSIELFNGQAKII